MKPDFTADRRTRDLIVTRTGAIQDRDAFRWWLAQMDHAAEAKRVRVRRLSREDVAA